MPRNVLRPGDARAASRSRRCARATSGRRRAPPGRSSSEAARELADVRAPCSRPRATSRPSATASTLSAKSRDLVAEVVDVVLARDAVARRLEQARDGVAEDGAARVADVQRPGRVGAHELEVDALAGRAGARPYAGARAEDRARAPRGAPRGCSAQVHEAGPRDLGAPDDVVARERLDERLGDRARRLAEPLREHHRRRSSPGRRARRASGARRSTPAPRARPRGHARPAHRPTPRARAHPQATSSRDPGDSSSSLSLAPP